MTKLSLKFFMTFWYAISKNVESCFQWWEVLALALALTHCPWLYKARTCSFLNFNRAYVLSGKLQYVSIRGFNRITTIGYLIIINFDTVMTRELLFCLSASLWWNSVDDDDGVAHVDLGLGTASLIPITACFLLWKNVKYVFSNSEYGKAVGQTDEIYLWRRAKSH